jgi:hypothetical protein
MIYIEQSTLMPVVATPVMVAPVGNNCEGRWGFI